MKRVLLSLAVLVGALGTVVAPGSVAPASAGVIPGACPTSKGVTVVVNFGSLGGGTVVRCDSAAVSSTTGLTAMNRAGFDTAGTQHDGPGFVCRINNKPPPSDDQCINTPPSTAYWSYWYAPNGGAWAYSSKGAANRQIIVGGFEGWSFHSGSGSNTPPTSGSPTRPPEPVITLGPAASTTTHTSSGSSKSSTGSKSATAKPTATTATPTTTPTASSTDATPLSTSSTTDSAGGELPGDPPAPGRSPWPFVGGGVGIAAILGGAYLVVLRRRGSSGL